MFNVNSYVLTRYRRDCQVTQGPNQGTSRLGYFSLTEGADLTKKNQPINRKKIINNMLRLLTLGKLMQAQYLQLEWLNSFLMKQ